jgi:hypothetical protein
VLYIVLGGVLVAVVLAVGAAALFVAPRHTDGERRPLGGLVARRRSP